MQALIKSLPWKKTTGSSGSTTEFNKNLKEELRSILNLAHKIEHRGTQLYLFETSYHFESKTSKDKQQKKTDQLV